MMGSGLGCEVDWRQVRTSNLDILLPTKVVKGKIFSHYSDEVADFHLKCSTLMENPKNNLRGSTPLSPGTQPTQDPF
jgi:hypothetical protein